MVRKLTIGRTIKVEIEFAKQIEIKNGPNAGQTKKMEFATLSNNKDVISVLVLEKGFARTNFSK